VVFSDIDGTLIDIFTRKYGNSKELVKRLSGFAIPVVLCSSKTWAEQDNIRKHLELEGEPCIVENGGAIVIPEGYFEDIDGNDNISSRLIININNNSSDSDHDNEAKRGYHIIELGRPSVEIRKALQDVRTKTGIPFKGVSDVTVEELAKIVGMTHDEASRMSKRQYGETILEIDKSYRAQFQQVLRDLGFRIIHGGRFFDVTAGNDKGKAVRILMDLYREKLGTKTVFIGVGDSLNDAPMLEQTDYAILVQKYDGSWADVGISGIVRVEGIGPNGWQNAFAKIMEIE
jgi:mannosyl-3-phosphoglycerate phosphatase family protein